MIDFTPIPYIPLAGFRLSTHGLLIALGFVVAAVLARRRVRQAGLSVDLLDNAAVIAVIFGLIGARLVYILTLGQDMSFFDMLKIWEGGLSSHGGLVFGVAAGLVFVKFKKADVARFCDAVIPYLLLGWAIGRVGCFLNWDSYGAIAAVPWAVVVDGVPRHATQLYESFGYLLVFFLWYAFARPRKSGPSRAGTWAAASMGMFALVRFIVDFFRADPAGYLLFSRAITVAMIGSALIYIFWPRKKAKSVV